MLQKFFRPESPEQFFLFFGFLFSILFLFITPPFQSPDSFQHFYRTLQLSDGVLLGIKEEETAGGYIAKGIKEETEKLSLLPFHPNHKTTSKEVLFLLRDSRPLSFYEKQEKELLSFPNTILYPPTAYIPQVAALLFSKFIDLTLYQAYYFICITKALFYLLIFYIALWLAPHSLKWGLTFFSLLPMNIFLLPTLSPDPLITSLSFLIFVLALNSFRTNGRFFLSIYFTLSVLLSLSKIIYFLIPFAIFCREGLKNKTFGLKHLISLTLATATPSLIWIFYAKKIFAPLVVESSPKDPGLQLARILENPSVFFEVFLNTLTQNGPTILYSLIGNFGWMDTPLTQSVALGGCVLLLLTLIQSQLSPHALQFTFQDRLNSFLIIFGTFLLMFTSVFLTAVVVDGSVVHGIQGRYFLCLLPFLFILSPTPKVGTNFSRFLPWMVRIGALILLIISTSTLIDRFYLN